MLHKSGVKPCGALPQGEMKKEDVTMKAIRWLAMLMVVLMLVAAMPAMAE